MPRLFALVALVALVFAVPGCSQPAVEVTPPAAPAPAPRAAAALPIAPMPHLPGERVVQTTVEKEEDDPLKNEDIGLDPKISAALPEIERIDWKIVEEPVIRDRLCPRGNDKTEPNDPTALQPGGVVDVPGTTELQPGTTFYGRFGAVKARLLKLGGGNADSELAVARGLAWLAKQQKPDGSWAFDAGMKEETSAATGLALLPFLGAGETHQKGVKYKDTVKAGVQWLVKDIGTKGADAGKFAGAKTFYGQAIATLALVEAYGLTKDPALKAPRRSRSTTSRRGKPRTAVGATPPGRTATRRSSAGRFRRSRPPN